MRGIVPDSVLDRRDKIGFRTPEKLWLTSNLDMIDSLVSKTSKLPFIDTLNARRYISKSLSSNKPLPPHVWRLINFCRWLDMTSDSI